MKNPKIIFAAILAVLVCFAGYNLWSYFKEQQAIQIEEDRVAEERRVQRAQERLEREEAAAQERAEQAAIAEAARLEAERLQEERRAAEAAEALERQRQAEAERAAAEAARLAQATQAARSLNHIEGLPPETIQRLVSISSRYILDNPEEFLHVQVDSRSMGAVRGYERMLSPGTNSLMLYAAVSSDADYLAALLEIGLDINSTNQMGYTPLMFAAAYGTPATVQFLLDAGADISAQAYVQNMNALHVAALSNPRPDVIAVLVNAGLPLEERVEADYTALLIAASSNQNFEIAERLAALRADTSAYDPDGTTAATLIEERVLGDGDRFVAINDAVTARIIAALE